MADFPLSSRNRIKRNHQIGSYDHDTIYSILDAGVICHIAYMVEDQPICTPTAYWRQGNRLYWHGSSVSRMIRHQHDSVPVCLTVTHCDGIVVARSGFHCSMNYRSVVAFGTAQAITDVAEKVAALNAYVDRVLPGRSAAMRDMSDQETKATSVIGMVIEQASAKTRIGPPKDDEEDYASDIWAGVIPLTLVAGQPIPCPRLDATIPAGSDVLHYQSGHAVDQIWYSQAKKS